MKKRRIPHVATNRGNKNGDFMEKRHISISYSSIPQLPIGLGDLQAIESVIQGYLVYLKKSVPSSPKRSMQLRVLQNLQMRLKTSLSSDLQREASHILLTLDELTALKDALLGFNKLIDEIVPPSQQRDEVIQSLVGLRQGVIDMLASHSDYTN